MGLSWADGDTRTRVQVLAPRMGMEADDPRRFRRQGPAAPRSLNAPRAAEGIMSSFGPGKPGCFGEGGNGASVAGPLALNAGQVGSSSSEGTLGFDRQFPVDATSQ